MYYTCAAFNGVFSIKKKTLRIAGFFATIPVLKYLYNKRLKLPIHCNQLRRKIAQKVWTFSK